MKMGKYKILTGGNNMAIRYKTTKKRTQLRRKRCKLGMLMKLGKCIKAPEVISGKQSRFFKQVDFSEDSYAKEYQKARKYSKKNGGAVYTMVDGYGKTVDFFKGVHSFDRLGVAVLK